MTIPCNVIFKAPLSSSQQKSPYGPLAAWGTQPLAGALRELPNLFWPQADTVSRLRFLVSHVGICLYHFLKPTHFRSTKWLLLLIYTCASCAEKSLIDWSGKGQYIAQNNIQNKFSSSSLETLASIWYPPSIRGFDSYKNSFVSNVTC